MHSSCQSIGSLIISHAKESIGLLLCFLLCLFKKKKIGHCSGMYLMDGPTFGIFLLCTEGTGETSPTKRPLGNLKVNPKMSIFTKQPKYYFKWCFLHGKCLGKTCDPNTHPVLRTCYCEELLFNYVWSMYVLVLPSFVPCLLSKACPYLSLLSNVQKCLGVIQWIF